MSTSRIYGTLPTGETIHEYSLTNSRLEVRILTLGGIVNQIYAPDRAGRLNDVALGFNRLEDYLDNDPYFGAIIGRVAGRITNGQFTLDGTLYQLPTNNKANHLHGGVRGFDQKVWTAFPEGESGLRLIYTSVDGEEGYPGTVEVTVVYRITSNNELTIDYQATTDRATPISLTNHSYFNLAGDGSGSVADHFVQILGHTTLAMDENCTHLGRAESVDGKESDFRSLRRLGDALPGLLLQHGDHYLLDGNGEGEPTQVAHVEERKSGRTLDVLSNAPGLQFYTGAMLDGSKIGKSGAPYEQHDGLCLECQSNPNGVDHAELGDIVLRPGTVYRQSTIYRFGVLD